MPIKALIRLAFVCLTVLMLARTESAPLNKQVNSAEPKPQVAAQKQTDKPQLKKQVAKAAPVKEPEQTKQPERPVEQPKVVTPAQSQASCESEIGKYNWRKDVALAVAQAESGLRPDALNINHYTRDYSVGCFQINIYGANARTRPSEAALKNPAVNVAWAWKIYAANGSSFIGQWGVCRAKVSCY